VITEEGQMDKFQRDAMRAKQLEFALLEYVEKYGLLPRHVPCCCHLSGLKTI